MQMDPYTGFIQRPYAVEAIDHTSIIGRIWYIQRNYMEVFVQDLLSLLFTYNLPKKRQVNFYEHILIR